MPNPGLLHLWISCCNQRFRSSAFGTSRRLHAAYLYIGNRGKADMPHAVRAMAKRRSGPASLPRRDPCTDHGNTQPAVPVRHDGIPKRAERGVEHGVYEGRKILRIVPAFLFRASGCRRLRGLHHPDRPRAFTTLNVPAALTPASAAQGLMTDSREDAQSPAAAPSPQPIQTRCGRCSGLRAPLVSIRSRWGSTDRHHLR
jgi:hypothetical protein